MHHSSVDSGNHVDRGNAENREGRVTKPWLRCFSHVPWTGKSSSFASDIFRRVERDLSLAFAGHKVFLGKSSELGLMGSSPLSRL
jgi:hypothetical protein